MGPRAARARGVAPVAGGAGDRAALVAALALPYTMPAWWDPAQMDPYFAPSLLAPVPAAIVVHTDYLRHHTNRTTWWPATARSRAGWPRWGRGAFSSTRASTPPGTSPNRIHLEEALFRRTDADSVRHALEGYHVRYLLASPAALVYYPEVTLESLQARPLLEQVALHQRAAR